MAPQHKSGLLLKNPVMAAAGTFGYGMEYARIASVHRLGAIISNGTTLHRLNTHEPLAVKEVASGLLYGMHISNPGIRIVIKKYASTWTQWETPVIVNIIGERSEELAEIAERLEGVPGVAGIEINTTHLWIADTAEKTIEEVVQAVRYATTLPLIVKLSPHIGDLRTMALAAAAAEIDAISLVDGLAGINIDIQARRLHSPHISNLSGPAIKPVALSMLYDVAQELRPVYPQIPLIGIGGICTISDALEFLMAGASAIQVGTINLINPLACAEIAAGIEAFLRQQGVKDVKEIIGAAL